METTCGGSGMSAMTKKEWMAYIEKTWDAAQKEAWADKQPTKIFGPNLEEILNSAGFYRKREWVGLTADEIWKCNKASGSAVEFHICYEHQNVLDFAESLEAKLREKNHG